MKSKQLNPKSVRQISPNGISNVLNKQRIRCSLCDSLLKSSASHRYFLSGKSAQDKLDPNLTYGECCQRYISSTHQLDKPHMICPKCCHHLQHVHSLYKDAEQLTEKIRQTLFKTKRLHRTRHLRGNLSKINVSLLHSPLPTSATDETTSLTIKEELDIDRVQSDIRTSIDRSLLRMSETIPADTPYDLSKTKRTDGQIYPLRELHQIGILNETKDSPQIPKQSPSRSKTMNTNTYSTTQSHQMRPYLTPYSMQPSRSEQYSKLPSHNTASTNQTTSPYAQLMIEPSLLSQSQLNVRRFSSSSSTSEKPPSALNCEPSIVDEDQSFSPCTNDDDSLSTNGSKTKRLSRRQYNFFIKLPDQQSLNTFIESSSSESGSRWTWRRTSANSRGYKVYYVCNFSMRRHYHPCPAAMYALFHPEGSISIYSCGEHQHIPKDRLPVSITDATKDEIFKCLQSGMTTTDIREHLTRLQLPFGDARKLNNFIKYHKELLRFGTVTNVRIGGTAYRQPQCWAIRRQPSSALPTNESNETATTS